MSNKMKDCLRCTHVYFIDFLKQCHGLVQFFDEAGKTAALDLNKKNISGHVLSVLPSKFGAVAEGSGHYGPSNPKSDRAGGSGGERVGSDVPADR
jgi:hypothetical protein